MSRCTIPLAWEAASASAICTATSRTSSSGIALPWMRCFRLSPSSFSMTMKGCPLLSSMSWMVADVGVVQLRSSPGLRVNRSSARGSFARCSGMNFRANMTPQTEVFRFVNNSHSTDAKLRQHAVMRQPSGQRFPWFSCRADTPFDFAQGRPIRRLCLCSWGLGE